jgi:hypothetical protein
VINVVLNVALQHWEVPALHTQAVLQGAFLLAKAKDSADIAAASVDQTSVTIIAVFLAPSPTSAEHKSDYDIDRVLELSYPDFGDGAPLSRRTAFLEPAALIRAMFVNDSCGLIGSCRMSGTKTVKCRRPTKRCC